MRASVVGPALVALVVLGGCGGEDGGSTGEPPPSAAATASEPVKPPPPITFSVKSNDDQADNAGQVPDSGDSSTFRVQADRPDGPVASETVELVADPHPFGDGDAEVVATAQTSAQGRARLKARFDRDTLVRVRADGQASEPIKVRRAVAVGKADVDEEPGGRHRFSGTVRYPRDLEPEFRFNVYIGDANKPQLPNVDVPVDVRRLGPGRARVAFDFVPEPLNGWRLQVCIFPDPESGLSGPHRDCRGKSTKNQTYAEEQEKRRAEDEGG